MLLKIDDKKEKLLWELGFLAVYAVLLTQYFVNTTVVHLELPARIPNIVSYRLWLRLFALTFVLLKTARDERFSWKELSFTALLVIAFGRCAQVAGYTELIDLAILVIGARNVSYKKILTLFCGLSGLLIVAHVGASLAGVIEDYVFYRGDIAKHSYGFLYPNEFGAHVFFLLLGYAALRREKISYVELGALAGIAFLIWKFAYAKNNAICILLLAAGMLFCKLTAKLEQEKWLKAVRAIFAWLPLILCLLMLVLTLAYDSNNDMLVKLDQFFNKRLRLGRDGFTNYGVKLFGQEITMIGVSWPETDYANYNFLDCSYISILLRFGLAGFVAVGTAFAAVIRRAYKRKDMVLLGLLALCAVQCVMEHHLHEIAYNPFLLAVLADWHSMNKEKTAV